MIQQFIQTEDAQKAIRMAFPEIDLSDPNSIETKVIFDSASNDGSADMRKVWDEQRNKWKVIAEIRVSGNHDVETTQIMAIHEMTHILLGPQLKAEPQTRSFLESVITFIYRLMGISEEERLVTRATRQFWDNDRLRMIGQGIEAAVQDARIANAGGRPISESSGVMRFLLTHLPKASKPETVRSTLAAERRAILGAA